MNNFDSVCPGGDIAGKIHPNPPSYSCECSDCGQDHGHECLFCKDEISSVECGDNDGECAECKYLNEIESKDHRFSLVATVIILVAISLFLFAKKSHAEESNIGICDAIYRAEGGVKAVANGQAYGIRSVHYDNIAEAQHICMNTVRHAKLDFKAAGSKGDFIAFLSRRYCPFNSLVWAKNVRWFIKEEHASNNNSNK